jgi:hypothetical protein
LEIPRHVITKKKKNKEKPIEESAWEVTGHVNGQRPELGQQG